MKPMLETLESRLAPSADLVLTAGQVYQVSTDLTLHSLTLSAGSEVDINPGVHLTVAGGQSSLSGTIRYLDPSSYAEFRGGTVAFQGGHYGGSDPTPGNLYLDGGVQATIADAVFSANLYTGVEPGTSVIDPGTQATFTGPVSFTGYSGYLTFTSTVLSAPQLQSNVLVVEAGTLQVTASSHVTGSILTGDQQGATVLLSPSVALDVQPATPLPESPAFTKAVYLAAPESLSLGTGATLNGQGEGVLLLGSGSLPFSYFADATTVADLTRAA